MRPRPTTLARLVALIMPSFQGCADDITWVDPDVTLTAERDGSHGPRLLILGYGEASAFTPLATSPTMAIPVVDGLQGGTWTMPTLRIETLAPSLATECTLTTSAGETLGQARVQIPTRPALGTGSHSGPGWVEVPRLPIPVTHAPPNTTAPLDDLEGIPTTLTCTVSAAGETASATATHPLDVPPNAP